METANVDHSGRRLGPAPEGFTPVDREVFFAKLGPMNVHPRSEREITFWETPSRAILGITTPGYLGIGDRTYSINEALAKAKGGDAS